MERVVRHSGQPRQSRRRYLERLLRRHHDRFARFLRRFSGFLRRFGGFVRLRGGVAVGRHCHGGGYVALAVQEFRAASLVDGLRHLLLAADFKLHLAVRVPDQFRDGFVLQDYLRLRLVLVHLHRVVHVVLRRDIHDFQDHVRLSGQVPGPLDGDVQRLVALFADGPVGLCDKEHVPGALILVRDGQFNVRRGVQLLHGVGNPRLPALKHHEQGQQERRRASQQSPHGFVSFPVGR